MCVKYGYTVKVYMYVCMSVYIYTHTHISIYTHTYVHFYYIYIPIWKIHLLWCVHNYITHSKHYIEYNVTVMYSV